MDFKKCDQFLPFEFKYRVVQVIFSVVFLNMMALILSYCSHQRYAHTDDCDYKTVTS